MSRTPSTTSDQKSRAAVVLAVGFVAGIAATAYASFGVWPTLIFMTGFIPGLLGWLVSPHSPSFRHFRAPYLLGLGLYLLHLLEENLFGFHEMLSEVTGAVSPGLTFPIVLLMTLSVGGWIAAPLLVKRGQALGWFLAWTFFAAMGISELAHFIFPLISGRGYQYHGGLITAGLLAPTAWWGLRRLWVGDTP